MEAQVTCSLVFNVNTLLPQGAETLVSVGGVTSKILAVPGVKFN